MIKNVKTFWEELKKISVSCSFLKDNEALIGNVQGATSKSEAEQIVCLLKKVQCYQKQLRMYKEFWDNISSSLILVNAETGEILDANPSACAMYGHNRKEIIGMSMTSFSAEPECTKTTIEERVKHVDLRWHIKNGGIKFPVSADMTYFNDQGYTVCAVVLRELAIVQDEIFEKIL
jgi:PAS domain S-box-containing protein